MFDLQKRALRYLVQSEKIAHTSKQLARDRLRNHYPIVGLTEIKVGAMVLNQPNNRNTLNEEFTDQLFRFLCSYHHDHSLENIWVQNKGTFFSAGADYQQLKDNDNYMDKLFRMTIMLSQVNKPIFARVNGKVRGIAAYLLSMFTSPFGVRSTSMRLDETARGFVPICGGSHRLSRLSAQMGMYLALTGDKIEGDEMARLGILKGFVREDEVTNKEIRKYLTETNLYFRYPLMLDPLVFNDNEVESELEVHKARHRLNEELKVLQQELLNNPANFYSRFAMSQYRLAQIEYANTVNPLNSFSIQRNIVLNNYYKTRYLKALNYMEAKKVIQLAHYQDTRLGNFPMEKIVTIFSLGTLAEVVRKLESDGSPWAIQTLQKIHAKDPLCSALTFEMIKRAQNLSWSQCLEMEYTVASRILEQSELLCQTDCHGLRHALSNSHSHKKVQQITQEQILHFFRPPEKYEEKLEHEVPINSLHPNNEYIMIPDSPRTYLNRQFFDDVHVDNMPKEVKRFLDRIKIDYRNRNYDPNVLRAVILQNFEGLRLLREEGHRVNILLSKKSIIDSYFNQRKAKLASYTSGEMQHCIDRKIQQIFKERQQDRFKDFEKTAEIMGHEKRLKIFKNLRNNMIDNVVYNGYQYESAIEDTHDNRGTGIIYFDQKGKPLYEAVNPYIKQSEPLSELQQQLKTNKKISQEYNSKYCETEIPDQIGSFYEVPEEDIKRKELFQRIYRRYEADLTHWAKALSYREMLERASETSEEIAAMMEWTLDDITAILENAPKCNETYASFASRVWEANESAHQERKAQVTQIEFNLQKIKAQGAFKPFTQGLPKLPSQKYPYIYNIESIPVPMRKPFIKLLDTVLGSMMLPHDAANQRLASESSFDSWVNVSMGVDSSAPIKADVEYIYSYLAVLYIKEIFERIHLETGMGKLNLNNLLNKEFGFSFEQEDNQQISRMLKQTLYSFLDAHELVKHQLSSPQSKMLEFMNRLKLCCEHETTNYPYSFAGLMLLIAKDRKKLLNRALQIQTAQFSHQSALNIIKANLQEDEATKAEDQESIYRNTQSQNSKRLIVGYEYYLMLFDQFVQKAVGQNSFLPSELLQENSNLKQLLTDAKQLLDVNTDVNQWFQNHLHHVISYVFDCRFKIEVNITKAELISLDPQIRKLLTVDRVVELIDLEIKNELETAVEMFGSKKSFEDSSFDLGEMTPLQKIDEAYKETMRKVKNKDALHMLNNLVRAQKVKEEYQIMMNDESTKDKVLRKKGGKIEVNDFSQRSIETLPAETKKRLSADVFTLPQDDLELKFNKKAINFDIDFMDQSVRLTQFQQEFIDIENAVAEKSYFKELVRICKVSHL